jgi:hypothetical protein
VIKNLEIFRARTSCKLVKDAIKLNEAHDDLGESDVSLNEYALFHLASALDDIAESIGKLEEKVEGICKSK